MIEKKAGDQTTFGGFQIGFDLGERDPLDFIELGGSYKWVASNLMCNFLLIK